MTCGGDGKEPRPIHTTIIAYYNDLSRVNCKSFVWQGLPEGCHWRTKEKATHGPPGPRLSPTAR
jgi:hypothetical protein